MPVTAESRMEALELANRIRSRRSALKAQLRSGRVKLSDVLLSEEDWLRSMRVRDILLATPGVGKLKASRALQSCWLSPTLPLGRASRESRVKLLEWIERMHPTVNVGEWERVS